MSTDIVSVPETVAAYIEAQRTLASEAFCILDTALAALPSQAAGEPEIYAALRVSRRLLNEAIHGLDCVNIERAAVAA